MVEIVIVVNTIRTLLAILGYMIISGLLIKRNIFEYKNTQKWNRGRNFIIIAILSNIAIPVIRLMMILDIEWANEIYSENSLSLTSFTIISGILVVFGLMFVLYINNLKSIQYFPFFYYASALILYYLIGVQGYVLYFIYGGAILALIGLYEVAFRVRDDNSLGLGIFYSLNFMSFILGESNIIMTITVTLLMHSFGLYYATGKFTPFLWHEEKQTRKHEQQRMKVQDANDKIKADIIILPTIKSSKVIIQQEELK